MAENLTILIDKARPIDWIASTVTGMKTRIPWTLRINVVGDWFVDLDYVEAWILAVKMRPFCSFWFYTRSDQGAKECTRQAWQEILSLDEPK